MVPKSVLDAIRMGQWEYEPPEVESDQFEATGAMPGTKDKLRTLAERVQRGLPLWHPNDREDVDDPQPIFKKPR